MTGSVTIPIKAIAMNALSVSVARRAAGADLSGRPPVGAALLHAARRSGRVEPRADARARVRAGDRLRGVRDRPHQGGPRPGPAKPRGDRARDRAHRPDHHRRRAAVLRRDRRARDLAAVLHQTARPRRRARGRGRREHRQSAARPRPDGADGRLELVGAATAYDACTTASGCGSASEITRRSAPSRLSRARRWPCSASQAPL